MIHWLVSFFVSCLDTFPVHAVERPRYHTIDELSSYLTWQSKKYPDLVQLHLLGYSYQGRPIHFVTVSSPKHQTRDAILINGTHHGDEKSSTESVLGLLDYLTSHAKDPVVEKLLTKYTFYVLPIVNPDGHAAHTRTDALGRDVNRDYAYPERSAESSFKSESAQLVRQLTDKVRFRAAIAYHSGMEAILWPTGYTSQPPQDRAIFRTLAKKAATSMGYKRFLQSYSDYPTQGEFIDFAYSQYGTLAITLEVSQEPMPQSSELPRVVERSIQGAMAYLTGVMDLDDGTLELLEDEESPRIGSTLEKVGKQIGGEAGSVHH